MRLTQLDLTCYSRDFKIMSCCCVKEESIQYLVNLVFNLLYVSKSVFYNLINKSDFLSVLVYSYKDGHGL